VATHRAIPARPNLDQYRKQAKDLLDGISRNDPDALGRVAQFHPRLQGQAVDPATTRVKLADAQLVLAREHGFESWPKFSAHLLTLQAGPPDAFEERVRAGEVELPIEVSGRRNARALVLFALAGNASRHDAGIREIAAALQRASFCTVLADLLTEQEVAADAEEQTLRYDIPLLASRMTAIVDRFAGDAAFQSLRMGLFGSGSGAAAAASVARHRATAIHAYVSCAGRPDLSGSSLAWIGAPCLFIFGGDDAVGYGFMRTLMTVLQRTVPKRIEVIDGAAGRFEDAAHVARAAELAREWFEQYLVGEPS
jgi:pimeloyl-ACP methyl ester carboxylesterase